MAAFIPSPFVVRSRVTAWGFLVALAIGIGFAAVGLKSIEASVVPRKLGVFVEPPTWFFAALLVGFAAFMFLVGVSELARYVRPSTELVIDRDGVSVFGLLGERRASWVDIVSSEFAQGTLSLKLRAKGRMAPPDIRIHFERLDVVPQLVFAAVREHRADLVPGPSDI